MASKKAPKLSGMQVSASLQSMQKEQEQQAPALGANEQSSIVERALLVRFSIGRWYGSGADEQVVAELRDAKGATGEIGSFTKRLMKREHLADINRITADARKYHKSITLPWGEQNERLLLVDEYRAYKEEMTKFEQSFFTAVNQFMDKYLDLVKAEKKNLGDLWKASDYPSLEDMRANFRYGLAVDILHGGGDFRLKMSKEHAAEIKEELEKRLRESLHAAISDIYARLAKEVEEAKSKLDDPDARLQSKMFAHLQGVISLLPKLNIGNDPRITQLGRELQKELVELPVAELREEPVARKAASAKAAKLLGVIDALKKGK